MAILDYEVIDPPFSPTPSKEIREAFQYMGLSSQDVVLELGCGDARNLILAAKEFGAKGIGYELSDEVFDKAKKKLEKYGVEDMITLRQESLYEPREEDLESATVVYLYLSKTANRILESALRHYPLKILSRVFPMSIPGVTINRMNLYDCCNPEIRAMTNQRMDLITIRPRMEQNDVTAVNKE